jgi:hypothetical protein
MEEFRKKRISLSPEVPMNNFAKDSRLQRISNFVFPAACRLIPKRIRLPSMREPIFEAHLLEVGLLRLRILGNAAPSPSFLPTWKKEARPLSGPIGVSFLVGDDPC